MTASIKSGARVVTQEQISERARIAASAISSLESSSSVTVALLLRNDIPFFECLAASRLCDACFVPINWHFQGEEIAYLLQDAGASILIVHADLLNQVSDWIPEDTLVVVVETPPEICAAYGIDPALGRPPESCLEWDKWLSAFQPCALPPAATGTVMLYTSGTTGRPKGVSRASLPDAQHAVYYQVLAEVFDLEPGATVAMTGPMYHSAPLAHANVSALSGCSIVLVPKFDAEILLKIIETEQISHMHIVPTMMVRLLKLPEAVRRSYDVSSLKAVAHGAAPCPDEVKRAMIDWWGPVFREYYGSTEASIISVCASQEFLDRPGTVGRPLSRATVRIFDEQGAPVQTGAVGELYARLDVAPDFDYHNRSQERRDIDRDGLVTNGDLGYFDEDGYLYLCDRKRDMVISGGVNIYPAEIEAVLITHDMVSDCAVFGIPDAEFGERLAAVVQPRSGMNPDVAAISEFLSSRLARYKVPRLIEFQGELPRQDNGKIYKRKLRDPYWEGQGRKI